MSLNIVLEAKSYSKTAKNHFEFNAFSILGI